MARCHGRATAKYPSLRGHVLNISLVLALWRKSGPEMRTEKWKYKAEVSIVARAQA